MMVLICFVLIWSLLVLIDRLEDLLIVEQKKLDDFFYNILFVNIIKDLKERGEIIFKRYNNVLILFIDFEGFIQLVVFILVIYLVNEFNDIFGWFDEIMEEISVEKIEIIGDVYLVVCGLEDEVINYVVNCVIVVKKMLAYFEERNESYEIKWRMRVGIYFGIIVVGVVGKKKFVYDFFGDMINIVSRIEFIGEVGKINIFLFIYEFVKDDFKCFLCGKIFVKGKGELEMYFVN